MVIHFRKAQEHDFFLYKKCFDNTEFRYMLCSDEPTNFDFYIKDGILETRLIFSIMGDSRELEDIGFVHFHDNGGDCYTIIGGILPDYFNSGLGIICAIVGISHMFTIHPNCTIIAGVFFHNDRSYRMQFALGFKKIRENNNRNIFLLSPQDFDNPTVNSIKRHIDAIYNEL